MGTRELVRSITARRHAFNHVFGVEAVLGSGKFVCVVRCARRRSHATSDRVGLIVSLLGQSRPEVQLRGAARGTDGLFAARTLPFVVRVSRLKLLSLLHVFVRGLVVDEQVAVVSEKADNEPGEQKAVKQESERDRILLNRSDPSVSSARRLAGYVLGRQKHAQKREHHNKQIQNIESDQKDEEVAVVPAPDAVAYPRAMVVESEKEKGKKCTRITVSAHFLQVYTHR